MMRSPSTLRFALLVAVALSLATTNNVKAQANNDNRESFTPESLICEAPDRNPNRHDIYSLDYSCDSLFGPSAWQKKKEGGDVDYDLIIIGGGIGGAYLVNRLIEEFEKKGQVPPKIALFERAPTVGGRLMSAFGAGPLGLGVPDRNPEKEEFPLQEYGGMRISPYRYPLIYHKIVQEGKYLYGDDNCLTVDECIEKQSFGTNCCPGMLTPMNVGSIRYATAMEDMGVLSDSTLSMKSETYKVNQDGQVTSNNDLEDIEAERGSPFDKCVQLVIAANANFTEADKEEKIWKQAIEELCENCGDSGIAGMCALCDQFPKPAEAVISCIGYDVYGADKSAGTVIDFANEVLNANGETFLYLLKAGFQRFVMSLMRRQGELGIAPILQKVFTGLSLGSGADISVLAQEQVGSLNSNSNNANTVPSDGVVTATFSDGSSATARALYMGMLPFDMSGIEGLSSWTSALQEAVTTSNAAKVIMGWTDETKALASVLDMTPCTPGPCERLILDGDHEKGWMARQVWLWDSKTIMVYDVGNSSAAFDNTSPSYNINSRGYNEGMDSLVNGIMEQIRSSGITIDDPDWARLKSWPQGTFTAWTGGATDENFASHISRPLGDDIPVYYGNSEAAIDGAIHAWAEGALDMVENSLPSLAKYIGLNGEVETPSRAKIDVTEAILNSRSEEGMSPSFPEEESPSEDGPGNNRNSLRRVKPGE